MRYFVKTDDNDKITAFYRFDPTDKAFVEEIYHNGKWVKDDAQSVIKFLTTGDGDLQEVPKKIVDKWLPKAK